MFAVVSMSTTTEATYNSKNHFACICERNSSITVCTERQKNELIPRKSIKFNHMLQFHKNNLDFNTSSKMFATFIQNGRVCYFFFISQM